MTKLMWDVIEKTNTGPIMKEEDFENEHFPMIIAGLVDKYKIEFNPDDPVMADPDVADAIFKAAVELLIECGLYSKDTRRLVKFTEAEIMQVIASSKNTVTLGSGCDALHLDPRTAGDPKPPYCWFPAGDLTTDVGHYTTMAKMVAQEPLCDGLIGLPLMGVGDIKMVANTPGQTLKVLTEGVALKEAVTWAGRPDMFIGFPMSGTTPLDLLHAFTSGVYTKDNAVMPVQVIQDMRINYDRLNQAFVANQLGIEPWISSSPCLYSYIAGPEQAAIEIIAHSLAMMAFSGGTLCQGMSVSVHDSYVGNDITWTNSAAALAAERNMQVPWVSFGMTGQQNASLNDESWMGMSIACINACISGMEAMWLCGGVTGIECRFAAELTHATASMSVEDGIALIRRLQALELAPNKEGTQKMTDLYDMTLLQPKQVMVDQYNKFVNIFKEQGVNYPTWI